SLQVACLIFFFQAEDGIRDFHVTGVQTCALPILPAPAPPPTLPDSLPSVYHATPSCHAGPRSPGRPARAARCGPGGTRSGDRYGPLSQERVHHSRGGAGGASPSRRIAKYVAACPVMPGS